MGGQLRAPLRLLAGGERDARGLLHVSVCARERGRRHPRCPLPVRRLARLLCRGGPDLPAPGECAARELQCVPGWGLLRLFHAAPFSGKELALTNFYASGRLHEVWAD